MITYTRAVAPAKLKGLKVVMLVPEMVILVTVLGHGWFSSHGGRTSQMTSSAPEQLLMSHSAAEASGTKAMIDRKRISAL